MFKKYLNEHSLDGYHFNSDIFPSVSDREFWENFQNGTCIEVAEKEIEYNWPIIKATDFMEFKKSGNRMIMEKPHFDRRNHLVLFALAELKENKGRFLPQIVNGLFAICEETYWGLSAHWLKNSYEIGNIPSGEHPYIDLFAAETAEQLSMTVKLLREPLLGFCPEIVDRVEYELNRRIKVPYESRFDFVWMGHDGRRPNNWNPWILSNIFTVFLLTERDERRMQRALRKIMFEAQKYYDSIPLDGGCDEGPNYWGRAGASLFELVYQIKSATDGEIDFFGDEKLCDIAGYLKKVHMYADVFVNVADAHVSGIGPMLGLLYGFARETHQEELMNFSVAAFRDRTSKADPFNHTQRTMRRLIYMSEFLREMDKYSPAYPIHGAVECLPDMELCVIRKGDMTMSAKGGFNSEHHNHNDVGSFTLYDGNTPILIDVGISTYTRFTFDKSTRYTMIPWTRGSYHNIPLINGIEQQAGTEYRSDGFAVTENEIEISFSKAYTKEAGIDKLTRTLSLSESQMIACDRFEFSDDANQSVTEVLMCILPVSIEDGAVIIGERYRLSTNVGRIKCEKVPFNDEKLAADWKTDFVSRITVESQNEKEIAIKVEKI